MKQRRLLLNKLLLSTIVYESTQELRLELNQMSPKTNSNTSQPKLKY